MGLSLAFGRLGLLEVAGLAQMLVIELVLERGVSCLGEHALLFQDGEDAHWLEDIATDKREKQIRKETSLGWKVDGVRRESCSHAFHDNKSEKIN